MAKVLLIEPSKTITDLKGGIKNSTEFIGPSLGLLSIATVLQNNGIPIQYFSPNLEFRNWRMKLKRILSHCKFDFVGISNSAYTIESDMEIAFLVRKFLPRTTIVAGGYFSHVYPKVVLKHAEIDIVVRGDGEFPFLRIIRGKDLKMIPGVCFKYLKNNKEKYFIQEPYFMNEKEFEEIPPLNFSLYDYRKYWQRWLPSKKQIPFYTSKGCPFTCRFCGTPYFNNKKLMFLSLNTTRENIIRAARLGAKKIYFEDANFTANQKHCENICNLIIKLKQQKTIDKGLYFLAQARVDLLNQKNLSKMARAGFRYLFIGIESISPRLLEKDINKKNWFDAKTVLKKLKLIRNFNINPHLYLIFGIPTITKKELIENIRFAAALKKNKIKFDINPFIVPYPETEYFSLYKNSSFIKWEKIVFRRFLNQKPQKHYLKLPRVLYPKNSEVCQSLLNLWNKTSKIIEEKGGVFADVFINEAIKTI